MADSQLQIARPKTYIAMMVPYKVLVDDQPIGDLRNGQTETFTVSAGHHRVTIKQGRMIRSAEFAADFAPGQTIRLEVMQNPFFRQFLLKFTGKRLSDVANMTLVRLP